MRTVLQRKTIYRAGILLAATALVGTGVGEVGCSSGPSGEPGGGTSIGAESGAGAVDFKLTLPGGEQISSITYDLTNGGATIILPVANPGSISVQNSQSIDFQLGGVPAA